MSGEQYTLDANILFYAIDGKGGEKHRIALAVLYAAIQGSGFITVQALGEAYNAVTKKHPALAGDARDLLTRIAGVARVVSASSEDFLDAIRVREKRRIQFWDAMLWATARRHGGTTILTEDLHDRPVSEGVRYLNPFEVPPDPDLALFL